MEKRKFISLNNIKINIQSVFSLHEEECFVCGTPIDIVSETQDGLVKRLNEEGWAILESDTYGSIGYYCGCDYSDDMEESDLISSCCGQPIVMADDNGHGKCSDCGENTTP